MPSTTTTPIIQSVRARQILDSRGNPTIEVDVGVGRQGEYACIGRAAVPSGASTGKHEAVERRDGDPRLYHGKSVLAVIDSLHKEISPCLIGMPAGDQQAIDQMMCEVDGTAHKSRLGANAILAVSMAVCRGAALAQGVPLWQYLKQTMQTGHDAHAGAGKEKSAGMYRMPLPMMNVLNGGAHADNRLDIQECMIIPVKAKTMAEAVRMGAEVFYALRGQLKSGGLQVAVGDEGGFAPAIADTNTALEYLMQAIDKAGYKAGEDIVLAVDAAASEFYHSDGGGEGETGKYHLAGEGKQLTTEEMIDFWQNLTTQYPIVSLEDGLAEDDWEGYVAMTETLGKRVQLVGDDLFATNPGRVQKGISLGAANAVLVKPNQIGTVTETLAVIRLAQQHGLGTIISHRSGETEDSFIADLAVATDAGQIKTGSLSRSDRTAKYNQLIRIEEAVLASGGRAVYDGSGFPFCFGRWLGS